MVSELLKIQQGTLKLIKQDIKDIHTLMKNARKEVRKTETPQVINEIDLVCKGLKKQLRPIEQQLLVLKFKEATPDSVVAIREIANGVKQQKQLLLDAYPTY